jgi:hypothetical protein
MEQDHEGLHKSPRQLREAFRKYCHRGLFTSLPFLYEHDGFIKNIHWKATLGATTLYRGQADLWMYKGLEYRLPQKMIDSKRDRRELAVRNLKTTPTTYEFAPQIKVNHPKKNKKCAILAHALLTVCLSLIITLPSDMPHPCIIFSINNKSKACLAHASTHHSSLAIWQSTFNILFSCMPRTCIIHCLDTI